VLAAQFRFRFRGGLSLLAGLPQYRLCGSHLLDELEPGVDHSGLKGKALIAAKKKHHIGPLKNKQQLIKALQKAAGEELAEKAKQRREID